MLNSYHFTDDVELLIMLRETFIKFLSLLRKPWTYVSLLLPRWVFGGNLLIHLEVFLERFLSKRERGSLKESRIGQVSKLLESSDS